MLSSKTLTQRRKLLIALLVAGFIGHLWSGIWRQLNFGRSDLSSISSQSPSEWITANVTVCDDDPTLCAFAALLCDDELLPALRVLIHSIRETESPHPFVVVVLPSVTEQARQELASIADDVISADQLEYPYEGKVKFEVGINKQCRYSKLHLWAQTRFKRLIYLDVDTAVQKSIDHLFQKPAVFAGVMDLGNVYNTGVLILTPSQEVFEDMISTYLTAPSYNRGDQGFLNWYFKERNNTGVTSLAPTYNVPPKLKGFAIGKKLIEDAFVWHFTAETKPWSFHKFYHGDWRMNYHPRMFAKWRTLDYQARRDKRDGHEEFGIPQGNSHVTRLLTDYKWLNLDRQHELCSGYDPRYETSGKFPISDKYSVAISFYNPERLQYLPKMVKHYLLSENVHMVYITWHSATIPVPAPLKTLMETERFQILRMQSDSLNNRFNPIPGLQTQAVFVCDDDIFIPMHSIDFAFEVWRTNPESLVGYFPRIHGRKADGSVFYEMAEVHHKYDMVLTKAMFIHANFLHAYTCVLAPEIHRFVDMGMNCEDVAMNMMISGMTGNPPICIAEDEVLDFGTALGLSASSKFTARRDECTRDLIELFSRDTLVSSRQYVGQYRSNKFRKTPWAELDSVMARERQMLAEKQ